MCDWPTTALLKKTFHGHSLPSPPTLLHIFAAFIYIYNLRQSNVSHSGQKSKKSAILGSCTVCLKAKPMFFEIFSNGTS